MSADRVRLAVVGIGNPEAGDDAVGPEIIRRLESRHASWPDVLLTTLHGDLYAVSDIVESADRLLFVDAILSDRAGELIMDAARLPPENRPVSQHQTDILTVMRALEALPLTRPFPPWSVWGVTIDRPPTLGQGLSEPVRRGVELLCERLEDLLSTFHA